METFSKCFSPHQMCIAVCQLLFGDIKENLHLFSLLSLVCSLALRIARRVHECRIILFTFFISHSMEQWYFLPRSTCALKMRKATKNVYSHSARVYDFSASLSHATLIVQVLQLSIYTFLSSIDYLPVRLHILVLIHVSHYKKILSLDG